MTTRAQCHDTASACDDPGGVDEGARASALQTNCACDSEQHYQYRWDALNRLDEARRYDRGTSHSNWELEVRQQYRYDGANVRMVKRTRDGFSHGASMYGQDGLERVALYVMPGDFERRGLQTGALSYDASVTLGTETQYLIAGSRLVWKDSTSSITPFNRDARLTATVPDLLQSSVATIDLMNGELLERGTYLPSGVRETLQTDRTVGTFALEPVGFTGKEGDDEVGLVYFGERYLMPHLGRWASPDPLQVHAGGGGEFGNSYHYVSGNLLQARDPNGLDVATGDHDTGQDDPGWRNGDMPLTERHDMSSTSGRAAARELTDRLAVGLLREAELRASELADAGDIQGALRAWDAGLAQFAGVHLDDKDSGLITFDDLGPMNNEGNLYARYRAAAADTNTFVLGYGTMRRVGEGAIGQAFVRTHRAGEHRVYPIVVDRRAISTRRYDREDPLPYYARQYGATSLSEVPDAIDRAITATLIHEFVIHAARAALGLFRGHAFYGWHSRNSYTDADNLADEEAHYIWSVMGAGPDHTGQYHLDHRPEARQWEASHPNLPPPPTIHVGTYQFE